MSKENELLRQECERLRLELVQKTSVISVFKTELEKANEALIHLKMKLQKDYESLSQLFKLIVPSKLPQISGFEFSTQFKAGKKVNGDYFDVFDHKDKLKFGTILSKSPNPSTSAIVLALVLKMGHDFEGEMSPDAYKILENLLLEIKETQFFPDLFLGYFNKRDFSYSFACHGDIKAFIKSASDKTVTCILDGNTGLKKSQLKLNGGDSVILMTNGFFLSPNENEQYLSSAQVMSVINALPKNSNVHDIRHEILFAFDKHLSGKAQDHDTTLLVFSPDEPVLRLA